jgi:hypothetical protein
VTDRPLLRRIRQRENHSISLDLRIVAWLFLIVGLNSAYVLLLHLFQRVSLPGSFDLGLLCVPCYFGLVRLWPGWRTCALILMVLYLCFLPVVAIYLYFHHSNAALEFFGHRFLEIPRSFAPLYLCGCVGLVWWEARVLLRPDIVSLFNQRTHRAQPRTAV